MHEHSCETSLAAHLMMQVRGLAVSTVIRTVAPTADMGAGGRLLTDHMARVNARLLQPDGRTQASGGESLGGSVLQVAFDVGHGDGSEETVRLTTEAVGSTVPAGSNA